MNVYGRSDCCERLLAPFDVWVGDASGDPVGGGATQCGSEVTATGSGPHRVECGLVGSYVTVRLSGTGRFLMLDEVIAIGR